MKIILAPVPMSRYEHLDDERDVECRLTARDMEVLMDGLDLLGLAAHEDPKLDNHINALLAHMEEVLADGSSELEPLNIRMEP